MRSIAPLFAALCLAGTTSAQERGATIEQPTHFEIGRRTFFDFGPPFDYYELLIVRSAENGTSIERITLTPIGDACLSPAKYEIATGSLSETVPLLLGKTDPCKIPEKELRHERKRCKKCIVFSGAEVAMQVQCGNQTRIIRSDVLDRDMFDPAPHTPEHTSWTMELMERLEQPLGPGVMDKPMFEIPKSEEAPQKFSRPELLKDFGDGKFDVLFQGAADKPSDVYRAAQKHPPLPTVTLIGSSPIAPEVFPQLAYPPLGRFVHLEGTVTVRMDVDADGDVITMVVEGGHPFLQRVVQDSIGHWKFPKNAVSQQVEATIQFALNCPHDADQKSPSN